MKKIVFIIFVLITFAGFPQKPKDFSCNPHVEYKVDTANGKYRISYTFKDNKEILRTFKFSYNLDKTLKDVARYGVPVSFYDNVSENTPVTKEKKKAIKKGLYKISGNLLKPDRSALVSFYRPYCRAIAGGIISTLINEGTDTRENRVEMAMKFVQDIPYGIPVISDSAWEVHGIFTPPEVMIRMYGDCDSKAVLYVCILSYLVNVKDILFLYQGKSHALVAVKGLPDKSQKYIEIGKKKYIIADVTGPARLKWGYDGNKFDITVGYKVEKVMVRGFWFHSI